MPDQMKYGRTSCLNEEISGLFSGKAQQEMARM